MTDGWLTKNNVQQHFGEFSLRQHLFKEIKQIFYSLYLLVTTLRRSCHCNFKIKNQVMELKCTSRVKIVLVLNGTTKYQSYQALFSFYKVR